MYRLKTLAFAGLSFLAGWFAPNASTAAFFAVMAGISTWMATL